MKLGKLLRRGIEPIIAVVILVAITLVIAIGVIGWIMGWWGAFGATETLQTFPDSYIQGNTLYLHVKNTGSAAAVIYKVEVPGIASTDTTLTIGPGEEQTLNIPLTPQSGQQFVAGTTYQVKIYTMAGNVYSINVQARA
uniref:Type IV pilin n=1 Tax=Ignisphaera aggregans TaxID=334771 RepID=A0A7C4FD84_9CREN